MLESVTLKNLALIDNLQAEFGPGLNVITGATGSGKTLLLKGIKLVLGERASYELLSAEADAAVVSAFFQFSPDELPEDLTDQGGELHCRRVLNQNHSSKAYLNGERVRLASLQRLRNEIIDFHGQHDNQNIFKHSYARQAVDLFAGNQKLLYDYQQVYQAKCDLSRKIEGLKNQRSRARGQGELISHQVEELERFAPEENEWELIEEKRREMENHEELHRNLMSCLETLEAPDCSISELINNLQYQLERLTRGDQQFDDWVGELEGMGRQLEELRYQLRSVQEETGFSPDSYERLMDRRGRWMQLARKYNLPVEMLAEHYLKLRNQLDFLKTLDNQIEKLNEQMSGVEQSLVQAAEELSESRRQAAKKLQAEVVERLCSLNLEKAKFEVEILPDDYHSDGQDEVRWLFSSHHSEPLDILQKRVSGGEISRVLLAVKSALAAADKTPILVFDEIDVGISGEEARTVGEVLAELARFHQVICITHLPLVSIFADNHLLVERKDDAQSVNITAKKLQGDDKINELARLLSGDVSSAVSREQALKLLQEAGKDG